MSDLKSGRSIAWGEEIDVPRRPHIYRVVSPRPHEPLCIGIMLCSKLTQVYTHYIPSMIPGGKGRPAPHWQPQEECEGCMLVGQRPRKKWYGAAYLPGNSRIVIFEFTEGCPEIEPRIIDKKTDLRGWQIRLYRLSNDSRSRMGCELQRQVSMKLPKDVALEPSLEVLWGLRENTLPAITDGAARKGGVA